MNRILIIGLFLIGTIQCYGQEIDYINSKHQYIKPTQNTIYTISHMSKDSLGVMLTKNGYILTDEDDGSFGYMKFGDDDSFHSVTYNDENMYFFLLYAKINHPRQIDSAELRCTAIPFKIVGNQYRYNCNIKDQEYGIMLYILDSQGKILIEENESDSDDKLTFSEQVAIRPTKWE